MKFFILGATGYIGGSVAEALVKKGYEVSGLARNEEKAKYLECRSITPVLGDLSDREIISAAVKAADVIINSTDSDNLEAVEIIIAALKGTGKTFIHTSGSAVVSDAAKGAASERIYDEESRLEPHPLIAFRVGLDNFVTGSAKDDIRAIVICPTMVYGIGKGDNPHSIQIPSLIKQAKKDGAARYIGAGENCWSNVHIDDLVDLYLLAIEKAAAGDFFFAENGEESLKNIAAEIGRRLNIPAESWTQEKSKQSFRRIRRNDGIRFKQPRQSHQSAKRFRLENEN